MADHAARAPAALDRGPARAPDRGRQLPRAPLPDHRLRRGRRPVARDRRRGHGRFRRLLHLSLLRLPGGGPDRQHPAGTLRFSGLPMPDLVGGQQQVADHALPRRRPDRGLLRHGADHRCDRARGRAGTPRGAAQEPGPARGHALRQHHGQALRQRRLPRIAAPRGRRDRPARGPRAPAAGRGRRPADRPRPGDLLRAGGPRHLGLCGLGHPHGAGPRAGRAADHPRWRARGPGRRAFPRPGPGNHPGAGGQRDPRHRHRQGEGGPRRYPAHALLDRHLGLALHGHGRRRGRDRLPRAGGADYEDRCRPASGAGGGGRARGRAGARGGRQRRHRRGRPGLVPAPPGPARRCRSGRPGDHRRLQAGTRFGDLQLRQPRRGGGGRCGARRGRDPRLRGDRGRRQAGQSDDRRRPDSGRRGPGHRHRAL